MSMLLPKEKIRHSLSVLKESAVAESTTLLIRRPLDSFHYVSDAAVNPQNALQDPSGFTLTLNENSLM